MTFPHRTPFGLCTVDLQQHDCVQTAGADSPRHSYRTYQVDDVHTKFVVDFLLVVVINQLVIVVLAVGTERKIELRAVVVIRYTCL